MKFLNKLVIAVALLLPNISAFAYGCVLGGIGDCIWGFDKKEPDKLNLIDPVLFIEFCDKNEIYCATFNNGYNSIMGRYLHSDVYMLRGKGWGGPDYILENKKQAEQFAEAFKQISKNPDTRFFVKNDPHPQRNMIAIGYKEQSPEGGEEIKLLILPNEWEAVGDDYAYVPPDE